MESKANHFNVGLLALIAMALAATWLIKFGGDESGVTYESYRLEFNGSIQGLDVGSQVTFNGLPIGRVSYITLGSSPTKVDVFIDIHKGTRIYNNSSVSLTYRGVTGIASIEIAGGSIDAQKIEPLSVDSSSYISARGSVVSDVIDGTRKLIERITLIADRVDLIVQNNEKDLQQTVSGLARLSQTLGDNSKDLIRFLSTAESFIGKLGSVVKNSNDLLLDARSLLSADNVNKVSNIIDSAAKTTEKANLIADQGHKIVGGLSEALVGITQGAESVSSAAKRGEVIFKAIDEEALASLVDDMGHFSQNLRSSGNQLNTITGNFLDVSEKSKDMADALLLFIEPLQKELNDGGAEQLFAEVIGSIRSIGRAASEIAKFTNNINLGLVSIQDQIESVLDSFHINIETIGEELRIILEDFQNNPQSFIFQGEAKPEYEHSQ